MPGKTQRKYITMPSDWWEAIDAARGNLSVSEWLRKAARSKLPADLRQTLSEPRGAHRPRKDGDS